MSMKFPEISRGGKPEIQGNSVRFTYLDSLSQVHTNTKPLLTPEDISRRVVARMKRFHSAGPGTRESESSRADRKWISAHPEEVLRKAWEQLDDHGKMEMVMMLDHNSHWSTSDPGWAASHAKNFQNIQGDTQKPLQGDRSMPATSRLQRRAAAIAKHEPEKLYKRNRGLLSMNKKDLSHYSSTSEKGLPHKRSLMSKRSSRYA